MFSLDDLEEELASAGVPINYEHLGEALFPLDALINGPFSSKPYVNILLKYLATVDDEAKESIARALTENGNTKATEALLALFNPHTTMTELQLWAVGNALSVIDDKDSYQAVVEICKQKKFGIARQMLMGILAKIKTEESFQTLVECLPDPTVKGHAIEALGKFGDPRAIAFIEQTAVEKGKFETRAKLVSLKRLRQNNRDA